MKKTYIAPSAERIALETEEILEISFTGSGTVQLGSCKTYRSRIFHLPYAGIRIGKCCSQASSAKRTFCSSHNPGKQLPDDYRQIPVQ